MSRNQEKEAGQQEKIKKARELCEHPTSQFSDASGRVVDSIRIRPGKGSEPYFFPVHGLRGRIEEIAWIDEIYGFLGRLHLTFSDGFKVVALGNNSLIDSLFVALSDRRQREISKAWLKDLLVEIPKLTTEDPDPDENPAPADEQEQVATNQTADEFAADEPGAYPEDLEVPETHDSAASALSPLPSTESPLQTIEHQAGSDP